MEFVNPHEVDREFYNLFLGQATPDTLGNEVGDHPFITIQDFLGDSHKFLVKYAKRSGRRRYQDIDDYYPCIVIDNITPVVDKSRGSFGKGYDVGNYDFGTEEASIIYFPIPLNFEYQVTLVTDRESQNNAGVKWMLEQFRFEAQQPCFCMNKTITIDGDTLGVVVPYRAQVATVPRDDMRFQTDYTFTLKTYVHLRQPVSSPFIQNILIKLCARSGASDAVQFWEEVNSVASQEDIENQILNDFSVDFFD